MQKLLHVGCGPKGSLPAEYKNYKEVRLDIDKSVDPDIVNSIVNMVDVKDSEFDMIYSSHNIEHLHLFDVEKALIEFKRVLKNGGHVNIACPNLKEVAKYIAIDKINIILYESPAGPITPLDVLYGHVGMTANNVFMQHKSGFTASSLAYYLENAGFKDVHVREDGFNLLATAEVQK